MFRLTKPTSTDVDRVARMHSRLNLEPSLLGSRQGLRVSKLPAGFAHDLSRSHIGTGRKSFGAAARAFEEWKQFDLGWVAVANPGTRIDIGEIVAVEVRSLGLWSLNLSQIVDVTREREAFGFIYKTTPHHAEEGEERFLLTFDPQTEQVQYELEAVSRPHHWLAKLGYPFTRSLQRKFARDSHQRLREASF